MRVYKNFLSFTSLVAVASYIKDATNACFLQSGFGKESFLKKIVLLDFCDTFLEI